MWLNYGKILHSVRDRAFVLGGCNVGRFGFNGSTTFLFAELGHF
jgi:hypothetical protein